MKMPKFSFHICFHDWIEKTKNIECSITFEPLGNVKTRKCIKCYEKQVWSKKKEKWIAFNYYDPDEYQGGGIGGFALTR